LKISSCFFCAASFLIFTRSLPAFGRAYASSIPLHFVTLRRLRFTAFQPYCVCSPPFFQRLLLRTAIGLGSAYLTYLILEASIFNYQLLLSIIDWFGRFALNQGTPPKRRLPSIFYPPFHAHSRYVSLCTSAQLSRLWWLLDCRNPAAALLIRKKKFLALKRGTTFFAPCGAWGC
jgi:hypothetical protein